MNILPKKRWHVRRKENIARVRRDEANAAKIEQEQLLRATKAEHEARINALRRQKTGKGFAEYSDGFSGEHVKLFEESVSAGTGNKERLIDEKKQEEEFEKRIGLLTYLGQSVIESNHEIPWYAKPREKYAESKRKNNESDEIELLKKKKLDPLNDLKMYVEMKKKVDQEKYCHETKKTEGEDVVENDVECDTLEQLRKERLIREAEERKRAEELLARAKGIRRREEINFDERKIRYNSQFNPELARQNKP